MRAAALRGVPLAALAAFVGCAVVGRRIGFVVALVGDRRASLRSRACRRYLRGVPLVGSLLSLRSSALRRRRFGFTVVLVGCRRCSPCSRVTVFRGGAHPALGRRPLRSRSGRALGVACHLLTLRHLLTLPCRGQGSRGFRCAFRVRPDRPVVSSARPILRRRVLDAVVGCVCARLARTYSEWVRFARLWLSCLFRLVQCHLVV